MKTRGASLTWLCCGCCGAIKVASFQIQLDSSDLFLVIHYLILEDEVTDLERLPCQCLRSAKARASAYFIPEIHLVGITTSGNLRHIRVPQPRVLFFITKAWFCPCPHYPFPTMDMKEIFSNTRCRMFGAGIHSMDEAVFDRLFPSPSFVNNLVVDLIKHENW